MMMSSNKSISASMREKFAPEIILRMNFFTFSSFLKNHVDRIDDFSEEI